MLGALGRTGRFLAGHPLTRDHKYQAFARYASWQLRSRLRDELVVPWIDGTRLAVRRGMTGATGNLYVGLHEFSDMAFLLHFLRAGDLFVDVGANVGSYTVLASGVRGARTIAFEPDPVAATALHRNVQINRLADLVTVHEAAVGAAPGVTRLTVGRDAMNHVSTAGHGGPTQAVRMETLDRVLSEQPAVMIKLDVEGYERQVLEGAAGALAAPTLKAVLTEDRSAPVIALLAAAGLERFGYDPFGRHLTVADDDGPNGLFLRTPEAVERRLRQAPAVRVLDVEL